MQDLQGYIIENYFADVPLYDGGSVAAAVMPQIKQSVIPLIGTLATLLCLIIGAAVIRSAAAALYGDDTMSDICVCIACSLSVYGIIKTAYTAVRDSFLGVSALMDAMTGAMCVSYGLTGNVVGGSSAVSVIWLSLQILRIVCTSVLLPLTLVCFGVSLLGCFGFDAGLSRVCRTVKRAAVILCTALAAAVCAVLAYQAVIGRAADNAALRTVRFASASFVPVIGSSLSESAATVSAALSAVRTSAGLGGVVSILALTAPAAAVTVGSKLCMRVSSFLCSVLGIDAPGAFFDDCGQILSVLLATDLTVCVIFTVACALFCV